MPASSLCEFFVLYVVFLRFPRASRGNVVSLLKNDLLMQLELKLGLGGTSYEDFIRNMYLPLQLRCFKSFTFVFWDSPVVFKIVI